MAISRQWHMIGFDKALLAASCSNQPALMYILYHLPEFCCMDLCAGGHPCASQRLHAPEALAALHQKQAAQGAWRGGHLQRWQVPHPSGSL